MPKIEEKFEREARAARLIWARKDAGFTGPTAVAAATGGGRPTSATDQMPSRSFSRCRTIFSVKKADCSPIRAE